MIGPDVSEHNGVITWKNVRGARLAICKVNEGDYIDHQVAHNLTGIRSRYRNLILRRGFRRGAYDFLRARTDRSGGEEADTFLSTIRKVLGSIPRDLLLIPDVEVTNGVSSNRVEVYTEDWCRYVEKHAKRRGLTYSYLSFFEQCLKSGAILDWSTWVAGYGPEPSGSSPAVRRMLLWQFTDGVYGPKPHAIVGIGNCDVSRVMVPVAGFMRYGRR